MSNHPATPPDDIEAALTTVDLALVSYGTELDQLALATIRRSLEQARADLDMARAHIRSVEDALELEQNRTVELIAERDEALDEDAKHIAQVNSEWLRAQRAERSLREATTRAEKAEEALREALSLLGDAMQHEGIGWNRGDEWAGRKLYERITAFLARFALSPTVETEGEPEPS